MQEFGMKDGTFNKVKKLAFIKENNDGTLMKILHQNKLCLNHQNCSPKASNFFSGQVND